MISGGICDRGLENNIPFVYKQVLKFYRKDIDKYSSKIFQQDEIGVIVRNYLKICLNFYLKISLFLLGILT